MSPQPFWLKFISVLQFAMSAEAPSPRRPVLVPPKFQARQPHRVPPRAKKPVARPQVVAFLIRRGEGRTTDIPDEKKRTAAIPDEENRTAIPDEEQPPDEAKERRAAMILAQEKQIERMKLASQRLSRRRRRRRCTATLHLQLPSQRHCRQVPIPRPRRSVSSKICNTCLKPMQTLQPRFVSANHHGSSLQEQAAVARRIFFRLTTTICLR